MFPSCKSFDFLPQSVQTLLTTIPTCFPAVNTFTTSVLLPNLSLRLVFAPNLKYQHRLKSNAEPSIHSTRFSSPCRPLDIPLLRPKRPLRPSQNAAIERSGQSYGCPHPAGLGEPVGSFVGRVSGFALRVCGDPEPSAQKHLFAQTPAVVLVAGDPVCSQQHGPGYICAPAVSLQRVSLSSHSWNHHH